MAIKMKLSLAITIRLLLLGALLLASAHGFVNPKNTKITPTPTQHVNTKSYKQATEFIPRGGSGSGGNSVELAALPAVDLIVSNLQSGPYGVIALTGTIFAAVLPLTLIKKLYGISVAYGFSVFTAGLVMYNTMLPAATAAESATVLVTACMFYGFRLGSFLLLRDILRTPKLSSDNGSIVSRITFAGSLSLFYAFLVTPVMYALRGTTDVSPLLLQVGTAGAYLAWIGAILEAIGDGQKFISKLNNVKQDESSDDTEFKGPTNGVYAISRHPNYLGEILFWVGTFIGGAPYFGSSIPAWVCSLLGVAGIVSIMLKATQGLEKRQGEKYGGQPAYETWKSNVAPLFPFVK